MAVLNETFGDIAGKAVHVGNELLIDSKTPGDPPAIRLGALDGPNGEEALGKISFDRLRNGRRLERVVLIAKETRGGAGYVEVYGQRAGQEGDMGPDHLIGVLTHGGAVLPVPSAQSTHEIKHPDGIVWWAFQGDGNFVCYQNRIQYDYTTGFPLWAANLFPGYQSVDPSLTEPRERPVSADPVVPPITQPEPAGYWFQWKGEDHFTEFGDFAGLDRVFGWTIDQSDKQAYGDGKIDWSQVVIRYKAKGEDDNVSV